MHIIIRSLVLLCIFWGVQPLPFKKANDKCELNLNNLSPVQLKSLLKKIELAQTRRSNNESSEEDLEPESDEQKPTEEYDDSYEVTLTKKKRKPKKKVPKHSKKHHPVQSDIVETTTEPDTIIEIPQVPESNEVDLPENIVKMTPVDVRQILNTLIKNEPKSTEETPSEIPEAKQEPKYTKKHHPVHSETVETQTEPNTLFKNPKEPKHIEEHQPKTTEETTSEIYEEIQEPEGPKYTKKHHPVHSETVEIQTEPNTLFENPHEPKHSEEQLPQNFEKIIPVSLPKDVHEKSDTPIKNEHQPKTTEETTSEISEEIQEPEGPKYTKKHHPVHSETDESQTEPNTLFESTQEPEINEENLPQNFVTIIPVILPKDVLQKSDIPFENEHQSKTTEVPTSETSEEKQEPEGPKYTKKHHPVHTEIVETRTEPDTEPQELKSNEEHIPENFPKLIPISLIKNVPQKSNNPIENEHQPKTTDEHPSEEQQKPENNNKHEATPENIDIEVVVPEKEHEVNHSEITEQTSEIPENIVTQAPSNPEINVLVKVQTPVNSEKVDTPKENEPTTERIINLPSIIEYLNKFMDPKIQNLKDIENLLHSPENDLIPESIEEQEVNHSELTSENPENIVEQAPSNPEIDVLVKVQPPVIPEKVEVDSDTPIENDHKTESIVEKFNKFIEEKIQELKSMDNLLHDSENDLKPQSIEEQFHENQYIPEFTEEIETIKPETSFEDKQEPQNTEKNVPVSSEETTYTPENDLETENIEPRTLVFSEEVRARTTASFIDKEEDIHDTTHIPLNLGKVNTIESIIPIKDHHKPDKSEETEHTPLNFEEVTTHITDKPLEEIQELETIEEDISEHEDAITENEHITKNLPEYFEEIETRRTALQTRRTPSPFDNEDELEEKHLYEQEDLPSENGHTTVSFEEMEIRRTTSFEKEEEQHTPVKSEEEGSLDSEQTFEEEETPESSIEEKYNSEYIPVNFEVDSQEADTHLHEDQELESSEENHHEHSSEQEENHLDTKEEIEKVHVTLAPLFRTKTRRIIKKKPNKKVLKYHRPRNVTEIKLHEEKEEHDSSEESSSEPDSTSEESVSERSNSNEEPVKKLEDSTEKLLNKIKKKKASPRAIDFMFVDVLKLIADYEKIRSKCGKHPSKRSLLYRPIIKNVPRKLVH